MKIDEGDLERLCIEVRRFLQKTDALTRLSTTPILYLEVATVGMMHHLRAEILSAMSKHLLLASPGGNPIEYIDDHTMRITPYAGVTIVLSCGQRFAVKTGGSVGYRDIAFATITRTLPDHE